MATVACEVCKHAHPAPKCLTGEEPVCLSVMLPPWLHARLGEHVAWGERSPWVRDLIRRELCAADGETR